MQEQSFKIENFQDIEPDSIKDLYEDFRKKSFNDYKYEVEPVEFEIFKQVVKENRLLGNVLYKNSIPEGLSIYTIEPHKAVEINVIHLNNETDINKKKNFFLEGIKNRLSERTDWEVISYPMLGVQDKFVQDIAHLDFKLVGQSIVRFDFLDPVSYKILRNAETSQIPEGYNLKLWEDSFFDSTAELINLAFKNSKNACFDPRFLTPEGSSSVLKMILNNDFGRFLPYQTRIIEKDGKVEAFCLVNMTEEEKLNIPLLAVRKDIRNKGFGKLVLKAAITGLVKLIGEKKIHLKEINATVDTDNYPAIKMYRRLGFREDLFYPHAYFKRALPE